MADLTADAPIRIKGQANTQRFQVDTSTAQTFYKGQPVIIDQSADTVNVTPYVDALVVAATDVFMGIAAEGKTFASGAKEATSLIELYIHDSIVGFKSAVYTNADLGAIVYMSDSGVLSATAADNPQIGVLEEVRDGYAWVRIVSPQVCTGA